MPEICPVCRGELEASPDSSFLLCPVCERLWEPKELEEQRGQCNKGLSEEETDRVGPEHSLLAAIDQTLREWEEYILSKEGLPEHPNPGSVILAFDMTRKLVGPETVQKRKETALSIIRIVHDDIDHFLASRGTKPGRVSG